jgi:hypothetical protein
VTGADRERLVLEPLGDDPEVGRWLAALDDARRDTLGELRGVTPDMALVEASWVAEEILEDPEAQEMAALLPWPDREPADGPGSPRHLSRVDGLSIDDHVARLDAVRRYAMDHLRPMSNDDFHRARTLERYDVAPDWVVHHLLQHEAEHRSHIAWLRDTFRGS